MTEKQDIRDAFREAVFTRDKNKCVVPHCLNRVADAHHIIERALWKDESELGGYIVDNGASVCELHHRHAEQNWIPPQALREWAGIKRRILPKQFDPAIFYDKWGTPLTAPNRVLVKYPHSRYLTFSPSHDKADVDECGFIPTEKLVGKPLVMTIKMDGSNVKMTSEIVTARNGHDATHKSFDLLKARHSTFKHLIPSTVSVFGEWLYARHSIHYRKETNNELTDFLQVFAVYDAATQLWYGWNDVVKFAESIGLKTVPTIGLIHPYENEWELQHNVTVIGNNAIKAGHEGIVVRSAYPFQWSQFKDNLGKFVRPNHVATGKHWSQQAIVKNETI